MDIDDLVAAFGALPDARVGTGPRHPLTPDPALAPRLTALFAALPALARDPGYQDFMWRYAGMSRVDPAQTRLFYVFGYGAHTADFDADLDGAVPDADAVEYLHCEIDDAHALRAWLVHRAVEALQTLDPVAVRAAASVGVPVLGSAEIARWVANGGALA